MSQRTTAARATKKTVRAPLPDGGQPAWEIAYLFPAQGTWTEDDYFALDRTCEGVPRNGLSNGRLEVLPMPTEPHEFIVIFLFEVLKAFATAHAPGTVFPAGIRVKIKSGKIRMPDVNYMKRENARRRRPDCWHGADLVMEVVSGDARDVKRDWEVKPRDYARAGIAQYWIVDPRKRVIRVLTLEGKAYKVHGDFGPGPVATSVLLTGFGVPVDTALAPPGSERPE